MPFAEEGGRYQARHVPMQGMERGRYAMAHCWIDAAVCKGCGLCVDVCPKGILLLEEKHLNAKGYAPAVVTDASICTGCAACAVICPECAIRVER